MFSNFKEYYKISARNLKMRSLRSWLTVFGIVIGVFLIITLLSLSEGIKDTINRQLMSLGGNMIFVMPGDDTNPLSGMMFGGDKLERQDLNAIEKTDGVRAVLPASFQSINSRLGSENKSIVVQGFPLFEGMDILKKFQGWSLSEGRWPSAARKEVAIGTQMASNVFKVAVKPGDEFNIKGKKYTVTGILNSLGSKQDDSAIFMDIGEFQDLVGQQRGTAQMAMVQIDENADANVIAQKIKDSLRRVQRRVSGSDNLNFAVITAEKVNDIAGGVMAVIQFAIMAFASIAIVVGGIGITNTMYTSVRERTREIGIMKAIGATNGGIMAIFLIEAGIIGFGGGIGGTVLGLAVAWIVQAYGQVHPMFYFTASFSPWIIIFGMSFSFVIGCLAGILPARRAAKLRPIEALRRYE
ncbi:MAG: ABC transporter permease [Candidatus Paceibacterota bacterium]